MKTYLVGGAVRDELLGLSPQEKDWLVVGETPESLLAQGFRPVGKEFPVFLHPQTYEEYALARKEKKIAPGHTGFQCFFSPEVTLEEDLSRRDLTINAIAKEGHEYFDPFHGRQDLKNRILRHVSPAFSEDPLRVLRVARFLAQLTPFHFQVAPETFLLMKTLVQQGALQQLSKERVWGEIHKALQSPTPEKFFECLNLVGGTFVLTDQPFALPSKPTPAHFSLMQKFAWFFHPFVEHLNFTPPAECKEFSGLVAETPLLYQRKQDPKKLLETLNKLDALRRPERFHAWLEFYAALTGNREPQDFLQHAAQVIQKIDLKAIQGKAPKEIQTFLAQAKENALKNWLFNPKFSLQKKTNP